MKLYGWVGLLLLLISEYCLFRKIEPFSSWFYCFAWWSYILLADNLLLRLRGRSLLFSRRGELRRMLPFSIFIWLIFEAYNLVLHNWAYSGLPAQVWGRWLGYAVAFATVLPGIFITADILEFLLFGYKDPPFASECPALRASARAIHPGVSFLLGACLSAAPLFWPRYFFPAVWLGPIFLLDPLLERAGLQSLALQAAGRDRRRIWSLLAGGLVCGLMWEFWNYWAASRWVYAVPLFGGWKVFEMPLLGFLGFPPFALECWIFYHLLSQVPRRSRSWPARTAFWAGIGIICVLMFGAIDQHSVLRFVMSFPGRNPVWPSV